MANTVTVKAGDTLGKIAARLKVTVQALAEANGIRDVNKIRVGQVLKVPGPSGPAAPAPSPAAPSPPKQAPGASRHELGELSAKFETSGRGPGTVSGGVGDPGGVSYGSFQFPSKLKRPEQFLAADGAHWAPRFAGMRSGTAAFSAVWKAIALAERDAFQAAQHDFVKRTFFDVQVAHVRAKTGVDLNQRSDAVRDATWSTAVQHGAANDLIVQAMKGGKPDDRTLLTAIYAERGRKGADGKLVHFRSSSPAVQRGVARRFQDELKDALEMLDG